MDWLSIVLTSLGSGVTAIVVLLVKQVRDKRLEESKVRWSRATWVHQKQVEALTALFVELHRMKDSFQGATRAGRFRGEMDPEGYLREWQLTATRTWSEYIERKLLLPKVIVEGIDELFGKFQEAGIAIGSAVLLMEGNAVMEAADERKKAGEISFKLIPILLERIEFEARRVIHDESC